MSDNKKYYYMRLKENFFDDDNMLILESMPDGYLYCNILLKLYLRSLKDNGRLMLNGRIPYNPQMLATVTRHQIGTVERALNIFKELGLIEVLDNGAIYMMDIQNYIGKSSSEADRQREYQNRLKSEKELGNALPEESCKESCKKSNKKSTPELELEKELDTEREIKTTTAQGIELSTAVLVIENIMIQKWHRKPEESDIEQALKQLERLNGNFDMLADALDIAAQHGTRAKNWNYTTAIIDSWVARGYKTEEDVLLGEMARKGGAR